LTKAMRSPNPAEYESYLPIHQDGTCNGLQHYAALGGDVLGAQQVNLLPSERPQDVYTGVAKLVARRVEEDALAGNKMAQALVGKITRKIVKQTVMTSVYGVTYIGAREQIANAISDQPALNAIYTDNSRLFPTSAYLTKHTFASLKEMFLGARSIMDWLAQCARLIGQSGHPVTWTNPMGLPIVQPYRKEKNTKDFVHTVVQTHQTRQTHELDVNAQRQRSAFPPNYIHSLDSSHMMLTALECQERNITYASVHDSYWTHASTVDDMSVILREQFVRLHGKPLLQILLNEWRIRYPYVVDSLPPIPTRGDFDIHQVRYSRYFFN